MIIFILSYILLPYKYFLYIYIYNYVKYLDPYIFSNNYVTSVHCYMSINRWLLSNPLTDCLSKVIRFYSLNIIYINKLYITLKLYTYLGHLFNSLGCFLLDLLPYRNKSDSLQYGLLFRGLNLLIKLYYNPPKWWPLPRLSSPPKGGMI